MRTREEIAADIVWDGVQDSQDFFEQMVSVIEELLNDRDGLLATIPALAAESQKILARLPRE